MPYINCWIHVKLKLIVDLDWKNIVVNHTFSSKSFSDYPNVEKHFLFLRIHKVFLFYRDKRQFSTYPNKIVQGRSFVPWSSEYFSAPKLKPFWYYSDSRLWCTRKRLNFWSILIHIGIKLCLRQGRAWLNCIFSDATCKHNYGCQIIWVQWIGVEHWGLGSKWWFEWCV